MGSYTSYWARYQRQHLRGTLYAMLMLVAGLLCTAFVGYLLEPLDSIDVIILVSIIVCWLVAFTAFLIRASKVVCPRCQKIYSRGKYLSNCPSCGLRMLQEDDV